jgi:RNA polymerase sigma factor (sigma-70 family)
MKTKITTVFNGTQIMANRYVIPKIQDSDLVLMLKLGEQQAYEKLYLGYNRVIQHTIWRLVKNDIIAEDLAQDTFIKIFKTIHRYEPSKGRLNTWILSIARNTARDYIRSKYHSDSAKNVELSLLEKEIEDQYPVQFNLDIIDMPNLLSRLTYRDQWILDLCYFQGFSHPEAAEKIGLPLGTLKSRIRRSIHLLRICFSEINIRQTIIPVQYK